MLGGIEHLTTAEEILKMDRDALRLVVAHVQYLGINGQVNMRDDDTEEAQEKVDEALRIFEVVTEAVKTGET